MIEKIIEEMRQLRINKDYNNYRTLSDVIKENIKSEYLYVPISQKLVESKNQIKNNIIKWLESEMTCINELLDYNLKEKEYKNLKMLSQVYNDLKYLHSGLSKDL